MSEWRNYRQTNRRMDNPITRCLRRTFQAKGLESRYLIPFQIRHEGTILLTTSGKQETGPPIPPPHTHAHTHLVPLWIRHVTPPYIHVNQSPDPHCTTPPLMYYTPPPPLTWYHSGYDMKTCDPSLHPCLANRKPITRPSILESSSPLFSVVCMYSELKIITCSTTTLMILTRCVVKYECIQRQQSR